MRVLKIGRSSTNDIVLSDPAVSSQHASITISDAGEVRIKDLNSKNGTYVNGQRILRETLITAQDTVKAGNSVVNWTKYLNAPRPARQFAAVAVDDSAIRRKKTIGRNTGNDIVLAYNEVSGSHAQLIEKANGDIAIADSGSTNGTYVNGHRISLHILKPGDLVLLANKYPLDWGAVFPRTNNVFAKIKKPKTLLIAAAAVIVVAAAGFLFVQKPWEAQGAALSMSGVLSPEQIYARYKKSVVLIAGAYYYYAGGRGYAVGGNGNIVQIDSEDEAMFYTGTGFIVSNDGKIVTNKHIAAPWAYDEDIIALVKRISGSAQVEGRLVYIGCLLNDTHVSGPQDLTPCTVMRTGAINDIDVAVIQTNSKTPPSGAGTIVDLNQAVITDDGLVAGTPVFTIGFPAGLLLGRTAMGIQANNQDGRITQDRGDFEFGHNIPSEHGASGSPIFNQYGKLVGILNAGYEAKQGYNMAIKAKYAVELVK